MRHTFYVKKTYSFWKRGRCTARRQARCTTTSLSLRWSFRTWTLCLLGTSHAWDNNITLERCHFGTRWSIWCAPCWRSWLLACQDRVVASACRLSVPAITAWVASLLCGAEDKHGSGEHVYVQTSANRRRGNGSVILHIFASFHSLPSVSFTRLTNMLTATTKTAAHPPPLMYKNARLEISWRQFVFAVHAQTMKLWGKPYKSMMFHQRH